jgi:hypothetical protein
MFALQRTVGRAAVDAFADIAGFLGVGRSAISIVCIARSLLSDQMLTIAAVRLILNLARVSTEFSADLPAVLLDAECDDRRRWPKNWRERGIHTGSRRCCFSESFSNYPNIHTSRNTLHEITISPAPLTAFLARQSTAGHSYPNGPTAIQCLLTIPVLTLKLRFDGCPNSAEPKSCTGLAPRSVHRHPMPACQAIHSIGL